MKIKNYNPDLGLTLSDLRMLLILEEGDDVYCMGLAADVLDCVIQSVLRKTTFTFGCQPKQIVYDILMEKVSASVEEYEKQLLEQGYTQEDIEEYHKEQREKAQEREE